MSAGRRETSAAQILQAFAMAASGGGAASGAAARVSATYTAPTNIAVIKYWGKRDVKLNLPINSSVSVTLSQDDLRTKTTAVASTAFTEDRLWLNGRCVAIPSLHCESAVHPSSSWVVQEAGTRCAASATSAPHAPP